MKKLVLKLSALLVVLGFVLSPVTALAAETAADTETVADSVAETETEAGPQWEYIDSAETYLRYHNAVSLNGLIYMIGGVDNNSNYSGRTIVYNPKTNEFHDAPRMSVERWSAGSIAFNGHIYCFGGVGDQGKIDVVEEFDTKTETWSTVDTVMPTAKHGFGVATVGDKIYIIGGNDQNEKGKCTVDIYDPEANTWNTGASISTPSVEFGYTVLQNKIYVFGGRSLSTSGSTLFSMQVFCYDPVTDTWTQVGTLPEVTWFTSVSSYNNKAIIIGGQDKNAARGTRTYIYDPTNQTCTEGPKLNTSRYSHASAVVGNTVYALYGHHFKNNTNDYATTIEKLDLSQLIPSSPASDNLTVLLNTDETVQLSVSNNLADNTDFSWTSSDSSVAQVDENGKVTAVAPGTCSIAAENTGDAYQELIPVKVFDGNADQYRLAVNLQPAQTTKLYLTEDPTSTTWTSHDTAVATVNTSGKVTAVANGLAIINGEADSKSHHIYVRVRV